MTLFYLKINHSLKRDEIGDFKLLPKYRSLSRKKLSVFSSFYFCKYAKPKSNAFFLQGRYKRMELFN
ncbi:hypothetical protein LEP1GSC060_2167 [Leptospira weilii serovar Ranarum str. ICFT]|uniref:Uncharacterized protein n=1 Tax=Leptospira weilii serovar Ranarum str. ICFT TaxID=1218598 RepID=N1WGZ5_9LEPT|nr:hypothetical protein LEP1GSC060_2167 [Leptospira weilii serovar Ranarum str. ICFT]